MLSEDEQNKLTLACQAIPLTSNVYLATDLVSTRLDTVIDYQQHTTTVRNAIKHFESTRWNDVRTLDDLESFFSRYPNDKEGNTELATYLSGYKFWTRAGQLRGLVAFVRRLGVETLRIFVPGQSRVRSLISRDRSRGWGQLSTSGLRCVWGSRR